MFSQLMNNFQMTKTEWAVKLGFFATGGLIYSLSSLLGSGKCVHPEKKLIVITGCDSGIGNWLAFAANRWKLKVVAGFLDRHSQAAAECESEGIDTIRLDVLNEDDLKALKDKIKYMITQEDYELWCVVNNAGVMTYAPCEWQTYSMIKNQILVNTYGIMAVTKTLLPFLRSSHGRVINISSPQGILSSPNMSIYSSSKWAVECFSHALRRELTEYKCKTIIVRPCNLPHLTSILRRNSIQLNAMLEEMDPDQQNDFREDLKKMQLEFYENFSRTEPTNMASVDSYLVQCFRNAIFLEHPDIEYNASPFYINAFLYICSIIPNSVLDFLCARNLPIKILNLYNK